ncbi:hypothetical protein CTI14_69305, partial [Methylobacterium radiotolerans]
RTVDALALAESRMQHDVLRARTPAAHYDPIVAHLRDDQKAVADLRTVDALALAESRMQHDVLRARTPAAHYDPIVA